MVIIIGILGGVLLGIGIAQLLKEGSVSRDSSYDGYELVKVERGKWTIKGDWSKETKYCRFEIWHNKKTEHYKLKCSGFDPYNHGMYIKLQNSIINLNRI